MWYFFDTQTCVYRYKCIKFHQFTTNRAIIYIHGYLSPYLNGHTVWTTELQVIELKQILSDHFSPSLQMSFYICIEISRDGNLAPFGAFLGVSAFLSSNFSLCPFLQLMLTVSCPIQHDNKKWTVFTHFCSRLLKILLPPPFKSLV